MERSRVTREVLLDWTGLVHRQPSDKTGNVHHTTATLFVVLFVPRSSCPLCTSFCVYSSLIYNLKFPEASMSVKAVFNEDIRRLKFDFNAEDAFPRLVQALRQAFNLPSSAKVLLKYPDDEAELITVSSTPELAEAVRISTDEGRKSLKVLVSVASASPAPGANPSFEDNVSDASDESFVVADAKSDDDLKAPLLSPASSVPEPVPQVPEPVSQVPEPVSQVPEPVPHVLEPAPETVRSSSASEVTIGDAVEDQKEKTPLEAEAAKEAPAPAADSQAPPDRPFVAVLPELLPLLHQFLQDAAVQAALRPLIPALLEGVQSRSLNPASLVDLLTASPVIRDHPFVQKLIPYLPALLQRCSVFEQAASCGLQQVASLLSSLAAGVEGDKEFHFDIPLLIPGLFDGCCSGPSASCGTAAPTMPTDASPAASVHSTVQCDGCGMCPLIGARYKCTVCNNFDLCTACEASGTHPLDHPLLKIQRPPVETDEKGRFIHRGFWCDGCNVTPIAGDRYVVVLSCQIHFFSKCLV